MQRIPLRKLITVGVTLLLLGLSIFSVVVITRAQQNAPYVMTDQVAPLVRQARLVGPADAQQQLNLSVGLQLRNRQELVSLLSDLYNPQSPSYHQFLSPQQFAAEFDPTPDQVQQVKTYLQQQGLAITSVAPNGLLIDASATVAQAEAAFRVTINNYILGSNAFYANANAPTIPGALSSLITSIGGLDNSVKMRPLDTLSGQPHGKAKPALTSGSHTAHTPHATQSGYGPSDLSGAYDAKSLQSSSADGSGQTVAIFELDGYQSSDITAYLQNYGLGTPNISNVLVDGYNGAAGSGAIEVELDIEVVAAMASKANQIVYEGPNSTQGVNDTYNKIITDDKAQVMTTSWGECEAQSGNSELQTLDNILAQGSAEGIAMYAAAGDAGAYDCDNTSLAVDNPADDPNISGVGGTTLQISNGAYGSETVWGDASDTSESPEGAGGGGGLSTYFKMPSWQNAPGVQNQYSNGYREVPDVTADADPNTGYAVYCTVSAAGCSSSGWIVVGGTSAAAPLWAGSTALINNYLQSQNKSRLGFANPTLYALANTKQTYTPFHDITSGTNLYYPATAGYDLASGLGSPDVYNIARDVAGGVTTPPPTPTPNPSPTSTSTPPPTPSPTSTTTPFPSPTVTNTPVPSPTITATQPPSPTPTSGNLIQNGDFEQGPGVGWQESSSGGYELITTDNPHTGNYSAYLCGYSSCRDSISQDFTIPDGASSLTIDFWWFGETDRTSSRCVDKFTATVLDSNGNLIGKLKSACNTNADQNWHEVQVDASSLLSNYAGQTVTLVFAATTSSSNATTAFFVDDVVVSAS